MLTTTNDDRPGRTVGEASSAPPTEPQLNDRELLDAALGAGEGQRTASGAISVNTGAFTGRSPQDKYVVDEPGSMDAIWWGAVNQPMPEASFDRLLSDVETYLAGQQTWLQRLAVGADPIFQYPVHLTTERAWVALFARHLFIVPEAPANGRDPITVLHAPGFKADPATLGTRSSTVIALHPTRRIIVIVGTAYAGEVKKSVFTLMQYLLPKREIATMHCSANIDDSGQSTLFFGLSGTGKTTLSNDPRFRLVGDDEHGWSDNGVFNLEGGCYAKTINLSREDEPGIYAASTRAGTVLENVVLDASGNPDFDDDSLTENTRSAFSISAMPNAIASGLAPHPSRIVFLTADATGVLPPVARLSRAQAIGLFLLGFTSKVAGTERGLTEPEMTFSPAFGSPFLPLPPDRYAELLAARIEEHAPSLWLVNTGWSGGSYASGANRISIAHTRAIVQAIADGSLDRGDFTIDPVFGFEVPERLDGIPDETLHPRRAWDDPAAFDVRAHRLKDAFRRTAAAMEIGPDWSRWLDDEPIA
jgi:phosphoenolpyruvate carboxykinase (ATP)